MSTAAIPVHHLPGQTTGGVLVERFHPRKTAIRNDVHRHEFHEIFFIGEGSGQHMIDLQTHDFAAPCMHAIAPGQVHRLARSAGSSGCVVMFQRELVDGAAGEQDIRQLFGPWNARPTVPLSGAQLQEAQMLTGLIENETRLGGITAQRAAAGLLGVLLAKSAQWMPGSSTGSDDHAANDPVRRFLADVERDFLTERRVSAYADRYALSPDHLSDLLRQRLGKSAMDVLQDRLILEAKRLLLHSSMSVKEVGFALNMEDPAYFSRVFKKATELTPGEYRDHVRELYKG
jgi:AraC family transcriptional activator of pobA